MQYWRTLSIALVISLFLAGCSATEPVEVSTESSASTTTIAPVTQPLVDTSSPRTLIDATDQWRIGAEYVGTLLVVGGVELDASAVVGSFPGSRNFGLRGGGCGVGSGRFDWEDGLVSRWERLLDLVMCEPVDVDVFEAILELSSDDFTMTGTGDTLTMTSERHHLEMVTSGQGESVTISDVERFVGVETDIAGIDPKRIQLEAPAFFVLVATLPTCQLHGGLMAIDDVSSTVAFAEQPGQDPCEFSPEEDLLARSFLQSQPTLVRVGDLVTIAGEPGTVTLGLANSDERPIEPENVPPPKLVNPDPPIRPDGAQKGRLSTPWFVERDASDPPGKFDVPVPPEWEAQNDGSASVSVVGRGRLSMAKVDKWVASGADGQELVEGPIAVTTPTFEVLDGVVVESGNVLTGSQYRYASSTSIVKIVVWVFPYQGVEAVATVAYPDFGSDSGFENEDDRNQPLTGLDAIELLKDIRIFE